MVYNACMLSDRLIKSLKNDSAFQQFQDYAIDKVKELDSISDLNDLTNEQIGEEARARVLAINKLQAILAPFMDFREKQEVNKKEIAKKKRKFGL